MKDLLKIAKEKIEEEIKENGFIDDSDNIEERFLDNLVDELENENLLDDIREKIMCNYNKIYANVNGCYEGYYYSLDEKFDNLEEFYNHFGLGE